jgi:hypothetical protein
MFELSQLYEQHQIGVAILQKLNGGFDSVLLSPRDDARFSYYAWAPVRVDTNGAKRAAHGVTRRRSRQPR